MREEKFGFMWATIAAGVAANSLKRKSTTDIAKDTDELMAEYEKREAARFPEEKPPVSEGFGDGR